jgi:hypothetical protein
MVGWLLLALGTIGAVEVLLRLDTFSTALKLVGVVSKASRVVGSRAISDHWKETALLAYSVSIMGHCGRLVRDLLAIVAPVAVAGIIGVFGGWPVFEVLASWTGIVASIVVATVYYGGRSRLVGV